MMEHKLRIIFMGTPDFAVPSLKILLENNYKILATVTAPDKPAGRGQKIQESAVKEFANQHGLLTLQPEKLQDPFFLETLKRLKPDLHVVVAFRMLPEIVWSLPVYGTINLHASLLPDYRGAAPINWAVINGEKETGLTTFFLQKEIDTGKILFREKEPIRESDTAGELHDRLMLKGANLLLKTVEAIESGQYTPIDQLTLINRNASLKPAPKIFRENCELQWSKKGDELQNLIRGLSPYPGAWCEIKDDKGIKLVLKIFSSEFTSEIHNTAPGEHFTDCKTFLRIVVADGFINLLSVQLEGKKRMSITEFLRGQHNIQNLSFR
jgi:methionyl-tRNA formyltransferase